MSTDPPERPKGGGPQPKVRDDDARGAKPGQRGQQPFVPTEEQRQLVRTYAKATTVEGERFIAIKLGVSLSTLRRHFADDILIGRADLAISLGAQMVNGALDAENKTVKGDLDRQKFVLARLCGWTTKIQTGDDAGKPFGGSVDLSRLSPEDLETYGRLSALAEGMDPDQIVGSPEAD